MVPHGQISHVAHRQKVGACNMGAQDDRGQAEQRISRSGGS